MTKREARIEALHVSSILVKRSVDQDGLQCDYPEADQDKLAKEIRQIADSLFKRAIKLEKGAK